MSNTLAKFMWIVARVDSRQYRQNSTELQPENFWVGVEVPMTKEYVWNADEILKVREAKATSELGYDAKLPIPDEPNPIYTNKAIELCLNELGKYLRDPEPSDFKQEDNDDWGDTSTESASVAGTDDWSDAVDTDDKHKDEEKWDESEEKWDE